MRQGVAGPADAVCFDTGCSNSQHVPLHSTAPGHGLNGHAVVHAEKFKREHAEVGVHLVVENTRRCCQAVSRGELDFAVVGGKIPVDLQHLLLVSCPSSLQ